MSRIPGSRRVQNFIYGRRLELLPLDPAFRVDHRLIRSDGEKLTGGWNHLLCA